MIALDQGSIRLQKVLKADGLWLQSETGNNQNNVGKKQFSGGRFYLYSTAKTITKQGQIEAGRGSYSIFGVMRELLAFSFILIFPSDGFCFALISDL